jgi:hypothetical protein
MSLALVALPPGCTGAIGWPALAAVVGSIAAAASRREVRAFTKRDVQERA